MGAWVIAMLLAAEAKEPAGAAEVREIYGACKSLEATVKPIEWVETGALQNSGKFGGRWIRRGAFDGGDIWTAVDLYFEGDVLRFAVLGETSPSGDWTQGTEYCFRADGSRAFVFSTLKTFYGSVKAETRKYYDPAGKEIWSRKAKFDLSTGKPTKNEFMDRPPRELRDAKAVLDLVPREKR
jgi:hypothetical protein